MGSCRGRMDAGLVRHPTLVHIDRPMQSDLFARVIGHASTLVAAVCFQPEPHQSAHGRHHKAISYQRSDSRGLDSLSVCNLPCEA